MGFDRFPLECRRTASAARRIGMLAALLVLAGASAGVAGDWPQFRGPTGQGLSTEKGVPVEFGEDQNLLWKSPLPGRGWSSPVVLAGQVWLTAAENDGKSLRALCVDLKTGALVHNVEVFTPAEPLEVNAKNSHASPTPVLEPGRVYVHFGAMGTACLDTKTGDVLWKTEELKIDHKEGPGSSPILVDDLLVVHCDGRDLQYVAALDTRTGKLRWKTPRSAPTRDNIEFKKAYCTPLLVESNGRRQLVSPGPDQVQGYDPVTGEELWRIRYVGFSNVPRPVFMDGTLFISTGYMKPELWAIRPDGDGDVTRTHVLWTYTKQVPANPSPLAYDGLIYTVSDQGVLMCLDASTGKPVWQERLGGNFWASPVLAEGRLYFCGEDGAVSVVRAGRTFEREAKTKLDGSIFASPALVDATLLIRTDKALYRFGTK